MLSSCCNCSENFSRERFDKTHVTRDNPTITSVVCVAVTPGKIMEALKSVWKFWKYLNMRILLSVQISFVDSVVGQPIKDGSVGHLK
jgi:hypothetical protein